MLRPTEPPAPPQGFDPIAEARRLLRIGRAATLATLDETGAPLATLVNVATDMDGALLLLISKLAAHTRNIDRDGRVSVLIAPAGRGDALAHPRLTLSGSAMPVDRAGDEGLRVRRRFLARHPKSALYADFPDFSFRRIVPAAFHLNGGFARASDPAPGAVLPDPDAAAAIAALEEDALAHMNTDHRDAVALYAVVIAGERPGRWTAIGLDPHGIDLAAGSAFARVAFDGPVADAAALRRALAALAARARAAQGDHSSGRGERSRS